MATIWQRGDKWAVKIRMKGVTKNATFERHQDAKAWAARIESQIMDGIQGNAPRNIFFGDLLARYMKEVTPQKRGAKKEEHRIGRIMKTSLADVAVSDLRPQDFANWRDDRLKEVSPDSVNRELSTLSAVCNQAIREWGLMRDNPVQKISKPKNAKPRTRRPTQEEIKNLCIALGYFEDKPPTTKSARAGAAFLFAIETAMRAGEICGLEKSSVDRKRRVVRLTETKNGYARDVPLSKRAMWILDHLESADIKGDKVFGIDAPTLDALFRRAKKNCGIEDLHFHDSRREALTRMSQKVDVMILAKISGHRDIRILQNVYYNPDIANVVDLLD